METFLKLVAEDLYTKLNGDLSRTALVFPNKRAGLFFDDYLSACSDKPVWAPAYITISDLFRSLNKEVQVADPIKLICELYKVFTAAAHSSETMDEFYFWGEILMRDFDDVDKNMADARILFSNLKDLKAMDVTDFLSKEQEEALHQFFVNFSIEKSTELKNRFISLWNVLGEVYENLRSNLKAQHLAYEGMLYRDVMEHFDTKELTYDYYVFIGFNVLNKVEATLFEKVREAGKAMFFFDYDESYLHKSNEAGLFIGQNLTRFGNELQGDYFNNNRKEKIVRFVASPTENGQARYLSDWIDENMNGEEKENAIVLCNETLLQPVIHALDEQVHRVNITMGFPLSQTPVYSFVTNLFELQTTGFDAEKGRYAFDAVAVVLKHPFTNMLLSGEGIVGKASELLNDLATRNRFYPLPSELQQGKSLTEIFTPQSCHAALCKYILSLLEKVASVYTSQNKSEQFLSQLYSESLFQTYKLMGRMQSLIESGDLKVENHLLSRLIDKVLTSTTIPFHGEPAVGLQIMGVLETRNLDFKNLVMLSLNEGQLPKKGKNSSFIPYNLRKAFGLMTVEKEIAVYAYYFYRLMQRTENITMVYNTSTDGLNCGEMSRFMLQYLLESGHQVEKYSVEASLIPMRGKLQAIPKTQRALDILHKIYDVNTNSEATYFSPTALNTYLTCTLKFYYKYVVQLQPKEEVSMDLEATDLGNVFHKAAENVYKDFCARGSRTVSKDDLDKLLADINKVERYVDDAFKTEFFKISQTEKPEYDGLQLINRKVIINFIRQLLRNDMKLTPLQIYGTEWSNHSRNIASEDGRTVIKIGGKIDRLDIVDDGTADKPVMRIVDYKTGTMDEKADSLESLFVRQKNHPKYIFQTFLYSTVMLDYLRKQGIGDQYLISPNLFYVAKAAPDDYSPVVKIDKEDVRDIAIYEDEFIQRMGHLLQEIFDSNVPFEPTQIEENCAYCEFRKLCGK